MTNERFAANAAHENERFSDTYPKQVSGIESPLFLNQPISAEGARD